MDVKVSQSLTPRYNSPYIKPLTHHPRISVEEQECVFAMLQEMVMSNTSAHLVPHRLFQDNWLICWLNAFEVHLQLIVLLDIPLVIR